MRTVSLPSFAVIALLCSAAGCADDGAAADPGPFDPQNGDGLASDGAFQGDGASSSDGSAAGDGSGGGSGDGSAADGASDGSADGDAADGAADGAGDEPLDNFSFFVTSLDAMRQLSGSQLGFGGDLRHGETGEGAGLRGADKICTEIADLSMPGSARKQWRAFLSTASVNAKDRIGSGPWYDRQGRLVAQNLNNLLNVRPSGADALIGDDLPNERGEPNRAGSAEGGNDDNHDVLTATNEQGNYDGGETCGDWTSTTATGGGGWGGWGGGGPGLGHSWPAQSGASWMAAHPAHGCAAGVNLVQNGPGSGDSVGAGGGYGGIYCFALEP